MPVYFFNLRDATGLLRDPDGTDLPDEASAQEHAHTVAGELMRHQESATRAWRLEVCDQERRPRFRLLFAEADPLLAPLSAEIRKFVIDGWSRSASLQDTITDLQLTLLQVRATIARAEGVPYVATLDGKRV
jgi:hypothetical protein